MEARPLLDRGSLLGDSASVLCLPCPLLSEAAGLAHLTCLPASSSVPPALVTVEACKPGRFMEVWREVPLCEQSRTRVPSFTAAQGVLGPGLPALPSLSWKSLLSPPKTLLRFAWGTTFPTSWGPCWTGSPRNSVVPQWPGPVQNKAGRLAEARDAAWPELHPGAGGWASCIRLRG